MNFKDLNLHPGLLKALQEAGFETPTPIQQQAIPLILGNKDLRASAQTGSGKTAAFILPSLQRLTLPSPVVAHGPRVLILVPTRELAMQVAEESIKYSKYLSKAKTICIYGGAPYPIQNKDLSRPYEVLVATPGRLMDHMERGRINYARLEMLILDEADRMLDMGFIDAVEEIAKALPKKRQTLLFSATLKGTVINLSKRLMNEPEEISVDSEKSRHEDIEQRMYLVDNIGHKHKILTHFLNDESLNQAIVFTSTKISADQLVDKLYEEGHNAAALHGDMSQRERKRTITKYRDGQVRILVATDIAARGIDVPNISHVINFDLPSFAEDYVHRIGRTGRAGAKGIAISFAANRDLQLIKKIEKFLGQKVEQHVVAGLEPTFKPGAARPAGKNNRRGNFRSRSNDRSQNKPRGRFGNRSNDRRPNSSSNNNGGPRRPSN